MSRIQCCWFFYLSSVIVENISFYFMILLCFYFLYHPHSLPRTSRENLQFFLSHFLLFLQGLLWLEHSELYCSKKTVLFSPSEHFILFSLSHIVRPVHRSVCLRKACYWRYAKLFLWRLNYSHSNQYRVCDGLNCKFCSQAVSVFLVQSVICSFIVRHVILYATIKFIRIFETHL